MKKNQKGFSLVELFLIIIIVGIIVAIALPNLIAQRKLSNKEKSIGFMKEIAGYCAKRSPCEFPKGRAMPTDDYEFSIAFKDATSFTITAVPAQPEYIGRWNSTADDAINLSQHGETRTILVRRMSAEAPKLEEKDRGGVDSIEF